MELREEGYLRQLIKSEFFIDILFDIIKYAVDAGAVFRIKPVYII